MTTPCSSPLSASGSTERAGPPRLSCRLCGQLHRPVALHPHERIRCVQCGSTLAHGPRFGPDAALAFAVTGLIFALPAALMPIVTVGKLGDERVGWLFTSVDALWHADMRLLAIWILVCGGLMPLVLLGTLVGLSVPARLGQRVRAAKTLKRVAHSLERWAMPEVQVLAVLVAFTKLGSLVDVKIGAGLWSYAAMSIATLLAWQCFELESHPLTDRRGAGAAALS